jgi:hypothetical protein
MAVSQRTSFEHDTGQCELTRLASTTADIIDEMRVANCRVSKLSQLVVAEADRILERDRSLLNYR